MLKRLIKRLPSWIYWILGIPLFIGGCSYVAPGEDGVHYLPDGSCLFYHNDWFEFREHHHIKWDSQKWVDYKSDQPVNNREIARGYGEHTMRTLMEGFQIARDKPYIFVPSINTEGKKSSQWVFFLRDGKWRLILPFEEESISYQDWASDIAMGIEEGY